MIKLSHVNYKYSSGHQALKNINLDIRPGEILAVVGKNGSGKSTLGNVIAGLYQPTGEITLNTTPYKKIKNKTLRQNIGIVFQNPDHQIIFDLIKDDFNFVLDNLHVPGEEWSTRIETSLKKVGLENFALKNFSELSLGQKQRVMIAEMLAVRPAFIVLDEPTAMIDNEGRALIYETIRHLKNSNLGIALITNNIDEIKYADRTIFLRDGEITSEVKKKHPQVIINQICGHGFPLTFYWQVIATSLTNPALDKILKKICHD